MGRFSYVVLCNEIPEMDSFMPASGFLGVFDDEINKYEVKELSRFVQFYLEDGRIYAIFERVGRD